MEQVEGVKVVRGMEDIKRHLGHISEPEAMKQVLALRDDKKAKLVDGEWEIYVDEPEVDDPAQPAPKEPKKNNLFKADHRGGGRYAVINTETGEEKTDELVNKDEAHRMADELNAE